jgi:hypothetical protein
MMIGDTLKCDRAHALGNFVPSRYGVGISWNTTKRSRKFAAKEQASFLHCIHEFAEKPSFACAVESPVTRKTRKTR